jgi:hypothetical protein
MTTRVKQLTQYQQMAADGGQQQQSVYGRVELRDGYLVSLGVSESASILITVFSIF